eukprot:5941112-Amphidinium_carterae.1
MTGHVPERLQTADATAYSMQPFEANECVSGCILRVLLALQWYDWQCPEVLALVLLLDDVTCVDVVELVVHIGEVDLK